MPIGKDGVHRIILAGAESTLRKDFPELVTAIRQLDPALDVSVMTNGIRFNDSNFAHKCVEAGLAGVNIGLNHPSYIDHETVRRKQVSAIENMHHENVTLLLILVNLITYLLR
jgi:molybdenum cofactor biosynthesis enzyme MoaA